MNDTNFISPEALLGLLAEGKNNLSIVDASWYLPVQNRNGHEEFLDKRIAGAQYFNIDAICDIESSLPHMLPAAEHFGEHASGMGIAHDDHIVVYDGMGIFSSARVWWMFKIMGAKNVQVLEGGFDRWKEAGHAVETGAPTPPESKTFTASLDSSKVRDIADIRANIETNDAKILDARPGSRFTGETPEPRAGLRSGHMPGAGSLPIDQIQVDGRLKDAAELIKIFDDLGVDKNTHVITSCGSGVTAAVITLALTTIGHDNHSLYDGSWSEWGQADDAPVETGS
ncbi:MAG: 3-mercaptopyruvate sulfurtransferase [Rhizobiaceae bacterium]|nr:3-mercaptopyruvate sulfurtransferase [Rhizobiaceae bacterium]